MPKIIEKPIAQKQRFLNVGKACGPEDPKEALIKKFAKGVRVEEGRLEPDAEVF